MPWPVSGKPRCHWKNCGNNEIDGLEYCVFHVPDELLEEAEEIAGVRRCRHNFGQENCCRRQAVQGGDVCNQHGANAGSLTRTIATRRVIDGKVADRLGEVMEVHGDRLLKPRPIENPFDELLSLLAEVKELKDIMRQEVHDLIAARAMRYTNKNVGEQLRVEILVYERAVERLMNGLVQVSKLRIEERLAGIREEQLRMLEQALDKALEASGVGLDGKMNARRTFRANVRVIRGELTG
jgi:hypothetical protein